MVNEVTYPHKDCKGDIKLPDISCSNQEAHNLHSDLSKRFEQDFFKGIEIVAQTGNGAEVMKVSGHGTMIGLKPESRATITFTVTSDRKGEWQMLVSFPGTMRLI